MRPVYYDDFLKHDAGMREIKFRLVKNKKIVGYERHRLTYIDKKIYISIEHSCDGVGFCDIFRTDIKQHWIEHDEKDQYIGLKDKNGKEIYEGGKLDVYPDGKFQRRYLRTVEWNDEFAQFQALFPDGSGQLFTKRQCLTYEVLEE